MINEVVAKAQQSINSLRVRGDINPELILPLEDLLDVYEGLIGEVMDPDEYEQWLDENSDEN